MNVQCGKSTNAYQCWSLNEQAKMDLAVRDAVSRNAGRGNSCGVDTL